jgi:hypothetical protein
MTGNTAGHGAPQEARVNTLPAQRAVNLLVRAMLRTSGLAQFIGDRLVTLYVIGRKTERRYAIRVAYVLDGDRLLIGTSFGWCRNLRTGDPIELRLKGRLRLADVQVESTEDGVVRAYGHLARMNPTFARFNSIRVENAGEPNHGDLRLAWLAGGRAVQLTPR